METLWRIPKINVRHVDNIIYLVNIIQYYINVTKVNGYIFYIFFKQPPNVWLDSIVRRVKKHP
jgi:hypothetical protein